MPCYMSKTGRYQNHTSEGYSEARVMPQLTSAEVHEIDRLSHVEGKKPNQICIAINKKRAKRGVEKERHAT